MLRRWCGIWLPLFFYPGWTLFIRRCLLLLGNLPFSFFHVLLSALSSFSLCFVLERQCECASFWHERGGWGGKERYAAGISSILYCCQLKITEIIGPLQTELDILATVYQAKFRCTLNDFISIQMASIALLEQTKKKTMKCSWYGEYGGRIGHWFAFHDRKIARNSK